MNTGAREGLFVGELVIGAFVMNTGAKEGLFVGELVMREFIGEEVGVDVVTTGQKAGLASFKSVCNHQKTDVYRENY